MHALLLALVLSAHRPDPALRDALHRVEVTRAKWDAAVAGDHPVAAGKWARRHFAAMQRVKALAQR